MPEPTEMGFAFQRAERERAEARERADKARSERQSKADRDPERRSAAAIEIQEQLAKRGLKDDSESTSRATTTGHEVNTSVEHPVHYNADPSGIECIEIVRHRNFNVGNAIKYLWRAGIKESQGRSAREKEIEDLKKARWYLADEIRRLGGDPDDE